MKKKFIYLGSAITITVIVMLYLLLSPNGVVLKDSKIEVNNKFDTISLMLETSANSGNYELSDSTKWPTSGYVYNAELSGCENGSTLIYNEETNKVTLKANKSDKCYVYFDVDVETSDISVAVTNLPETVGPLAQLNCSGATTTYNNKYNRIEVSQLNSRGASCNLSYAIRTSTTTLADKVISLAGTTQGTGSVVNENGYRYEGQNPNNYVWFNNELWRIIGVMDEESHGVASTNLVKIIRNEPIGGLVWDKSNTNDWSVSNLKTLLNTEYFNSTNGTNGDNCYGYSTTSKAKCDYTTIGIKDAYRSMIKEVTWYLGGRSANALTANVVTANAMYGYERGDTVYSGRPTSDRGKIGIMYVSDYGYAVPASSCARTTNLSSYNNANCTLNNWLYGNGYEWTITPYSSSADSVFEVTPNGYVYQGKAYNGYTVRPTLYLDSSVYVAEGDGSITNPYIIGM